MKLIIICSIILASVSSYAQSPYTLLTNNNEKTWELKQMLIEDALMEDQDGTCFYQCELTFNTEGVFELLKPCAGSNEKGEFYIQNNFLILNQIPHKIEKLTADSLIYTVDSHFTLDTIQIPVSVKQIYSSK